MSTTSSERSAADAASPSSSSSSSSSSFASDHSISSIDGEHLYQLACAETLLPLSKDVTPEEEPTTSRHPVARIDYSPNFRFIYGVYRALRSRIEYVDAVAQQRGGGPAGQVIRAVHSAPARWLLLLGFALRQCTSNYTVWKDRRDVLMSPEVLLQATRDQLPAPAVPDVLLSTDPADAAKKVKAVAEVEENRKKIAQVAQHWLPGRSDLIWAPTAATQTAADASASSTATVSPWRAVHWELNAVGCFTRFYHKNFQVWHHRKELLSYAFQQTALAAPSVRVTTAHEGGNAAPSQLTTAATTTGAVPPSPPQLQQSPLLQREEVFSAYLAQHHGLCFADVDERATVKAVLGDEDSKNYHAWLHLSWYLHAVPFLLQPPSWAALLAFVATLTSSRPADGAQPWTFRVHPQWAFVPPSTEAAAVVPACLRPTLPPSPLTSEMNFTAQLIHQDCLNNSAWCHRYALFKEDLIRRLWQTQQQQQLRGTGDDGSASVLHADFVAVVHGLCMVEADFALQWLYVDPTNEAAHTHARSVAVLYHTVLLRVAVLRAADGVDSAAPTSTEFLQYLRDASLNAPVAAAGLDLCATAADGTVRSATPAHDVLLQRLRHPVLAWADYEDSFAVLRHVQRVLHTAICQRVEELEEQAARVLRAAACVTPTSTSSTDKTRKKMLLNTLYERSSQYMLDNFHQVCTAQYLCCQAVLEEMWVLYLSAAQRRTVRQARPAEAYRQGVKPEWTIPLPWEPAEAEAEKEKRAESDAVVASFLAYEAVALNLAKQLSVRDPIRFKYWKFEAMQTMQRTYGEAL